MRLSTKMVSLAWLSLSLPGCVTAAANIEEAKLTSAQAASGLKSYSRDDADAVRRVCPVVLSLPKEGEGEPVPPCKDGGRLAVSQLALNLENLYSLAYNGGEPVSDGVAAVTALLISGLSRPDAVYQGLTDLSADNYEVIASQLVGLFEQAFAGDSVPAPKNFDAGKTVARPSGPPSPGKAEPLLHATMVTTPGWAVTPKLAVTRHTPVRAVNVKIEGCQAAPIGVTLMTAAGPQDWLASGDGTFRTEGAAQEIKDMIIIFVGSGGTCNLIVREEAGA